MYSHETTGNAHQAVVPTKEEPMADEPKSIWGKLGTITAFLTAVAGLIQLFTLLNKPSLSESTPGKPPTQVDREQPPPPSKDWLSGSYGLSSINGQPFSGQMEISRISDDRFRYNTLLSNGRQYRGEIMRQGNVWNVQHHYSNAPDAVYFPVANYVTLAGNHLTFRTSDGSFTFVWTKD
jgi:hypothetical protein